MAELKTSPTRISDSTAISSVDDALAQVESAVADIFGVPKNTPITSPILGLVDSSGRIVGDGATPAKVPSIYNTSAAESSSAAMEFVDSINNIGFRLVPIASGLKVYKRDPATENSGELIQDLGLERLLTNLDDVDIDDLSAEAGKILAIDSNSPYNIIAVEQTAGGGGATAFTGLSDTPISYNGAVDGMVVACAGNPVDHLEFRASASGGASYFVDLYDTFADYDGKKQANICVANDEQGLIASFYTWTQSRKFDAVQSVPWNVSSIPIDFGGSGSANQFPSNANMVQNTYLIFDQEVDRDCVYMVEYYVNIYHASLFNSSIGIFPLQLQGGNMFFRHENLMLRHYGAQFDGPPVSMNGSFIVRVPAGSGATLDQRTLRLNIGRLGPADNGYGWQFIAGSSTSQVINFKHAGVSICRIN